MASDGEATGPGDEATVPGAVDRTDAATVDAGTAATWWDPARDPDETLTNPEAIESLAILAPPQGEGELGRLGPYLVVGLLGSGGMGDVFRAIDPRLRRPVALKTLRPGLARDPSARKRFLREARAAAALEHDHVIAIHEVNEDRGTPYLVMPLLAGETLEGRLKSLGRLPAAEAQRIGREVAEGLAAAHGRGLIHRDIKPSNLWLEAGRDRVKILDFGLARADQAEGADDDRTDAGAILGTPAYMAPEQAIGGPVDERSDLFSLGCVLYMTATGVSPFRRSTTLATLDALRHEDPKPPGELVGDLPPAFTDLVMRLLAKDPARRPPTARAVAAALEAIGRDPAPEVLAPRAPRRRWVAVAAALLAILGLAAAGAIALRLTARGTVILESADPDWGVELSRDGKAVAVINPKFKTREDLRPGSYHVELAGSNPALRVSPASFRLTWGGQQVVRVNRVDPFRETVEGSFGGRGFQALYGAEVAGYRSWLDRMRAEGFRPTFVDVHDAGGTPRFAALATRDATAIPWEARLDADLDAYERTFRDLCDEGFRLIAASGYAEGGSTHFASIWSRPPARDRWFSWSHMTPEGYQEKLDELGLLGMRPCFLAGYSENTTPRLLAIFEGGGGLNWAGKHGLSAPALGEFLDEARATGLRPITATTYPRDGATRFAMAMVSNLPRRDWSVDLGLTTAEYLQESRRRGAGSFPSIVRGYWREGRSRYLVAWAAARLAELPATGPAVPGLGAFDDAMRRYMGERGIRAGTLAVAKDGRVVLARGYGYADREETRPIEPDAPLRLASVSKAFTAAAVVMLIREGKLTRQTRVAALLDLKPPAGRELDPRWREVTIGHLLEHRGGWDAKVSFDPLFRPGTVAAALGKPGPPDARDLVAYMTGQPLQFAPGMRTAYSNFGYCLLGRAVEVASGRPFADYLRDAVLAPLDIRGVAPARTRPADRDPHEPDYADPGPGPDDPIVMEAMVASGGLIATAGDVARFLAAYDPDGKPRSGHGAGGCYFGGLPGTFTAAIQCADGVTIAALFNRRSDPAGRGDETIRAILEQAAAAVRAWPAGDPRPADPAGP